MNSSQQYLRLLAQRHLGSAKITDLHTHTDMYHMDPYGERWVGQVSVPLSEAVRTGRSESCAVSALRRGMLHVGVSGIVSVLVPHEARWSSSSCHRQTSDPFSSACLEWPNPQRFLKHHRTIPSILSIVFSSLIEGKLAAFAA